MAIYHLSVSTFSRSSGHSATAAAAYRAGQVVHDERVGVTHDYRSKLGVVSTHLLLPPSAPALSRAGLWNLAESSERRKNSCIAREFEVALPAELTAVQRQALALEFAMRLVQEHKLAADVAIHEPSRTGDQRNHHAHILCTTRQLTPGGLGKKTRELDRRELGLVGYWRRIWEQLCNGALQVHGHSARVDHRSHADRGIEVPPTTHLGPYASALERRTHEASQIRQRGAKSKAQLAAAEAALAAANREMFEAEFDAAQVARELAAAEAEAEAAELAAEATDHARREAADAPDLRENYAASSAVYVAGASRPKSLEQRELGMPELRQGLAPQGRVRQERSRGNDLERVRKRTHGCRMRSLLAVRAKRHIGRARPIEAHGRIAGRSSATEIALRADLDVVQNARTQPDHQRQQPRIGIQHFDASQPLLTPPSQQQRPAPMPSTRTPSPLPSPPAALGDHQDTDPNMADLDEDDTDEIARERMPRPRG